MFRCQMCGAVAPAGTRATKVVVATRQKIYEPRGQDPRERRGGRSFRGRRGPRKRKPYDKGGEGVEIVRELIACPACAALYADKAPEHVHIAPAVDLEAVAVQMEEAGDNVVETSEAETAGAAN